MRAWDRHLRWFDTERGLQAPGYTSPTGVLSANISETVPP
jgi:hypothetical protein